MPFLSIIIPVYKVEPYLRECLNSIAVSMLDCWETILIDDGSPDACPQICDEYAANDKRFRVIHQQNAGVAAARNAGLDVAHGEWVWFVDSDDVVDMRPVGDMVTWLKGHQEVDLMMFDMETFSDSENIYSRAVQNTDASKCGYFDPHKINVPINKNDFLIKNICYHHVRLWYKSENCKIRFTRGIRLAEDLEFQYKFLTLCKHPIKIDATLYQYRLREDSATMGSMYRARIVEDFPIVLNNLVEWSSNNKIKPELWYDFRIMKLFQNLLYSASQVKELNIQYFQYTIQSLLDKCQQQGFLFPNLFRYKLAKRNIRAFFFINRFYLIGKHIWCRPFPHIKNFHS